MLIARNLCKHDNWCNFVLKYNTPQQTLAQAQDNNHAIMRYLYDFNINIRRRRKKTGGTHEQQQVTITTNYF